jgi:hypothetical protein
MGDGPEMEAKVKDYLLDAIRIMMKPLVRLMIAQGVTHSEFSDALKEVYVDVSLRHFGDENKINRSRVAILTGLTRKEVSNTMNRALEVGTGGRVFSRPERVLSGWYSDPKYQGPYGIPMELPYEATGGAPNFVDLVKAYSGDMSPKAMLAELVRGGSVEEKADGLIKVVRRDFEPGALSRELIVRFGEIGHKFFSTAAANIEKKEQGGGYFDRLVYAENGCTDETIERFDKYVKEVGQAFLENLDNWIAVNDKQGRGGDEEERKETGVYIVQYVESRDEKKMLGALLRERGIEPQ